MKNTLTRATTIALFLFCQNAYSAGCEYGQQLYKQGEYKRAFNIFNLSANNDACSQYYLGLMYKNGHYVKQNVQKAQVYFKSAEKNGFNSSNKLDNTVPN